jgi:F-type H+-transporting ATPase subunit b
MGRAGGWFRWAAAGWLLAALALAPALVLAAAEGGSEEQGIINLNITILIQVLNLVILILLLSRFLYNPLKQFMADRAAGIERALAEAKVAHEAAARAQEEYRAQIVATQREAAALREQAQREVEEERQRLLRASREESQRLLVEARAAIEAETRRARASLREEVVRLTLSAAERLLGRSLTGEDQKRLAEQYVRDLGGTN